MTKVNNYEVHKELIEINFIFQTIKLFKILDNNSYKGLFNSQIQLL